MKYCPRCLRSEADIANCPENDFPGMSCPEPVEENPAKDIAIQCGPCDFSRIVPVRELLSGASKNKLPSCKRDACACVVVSREAAFPAAGDPVMPEIAAFAEAAAEAAPIVAPEPEAPVEGNAEDTQSSTTEGTASDATASNVTSPGGVSEAEAEAAAVKKAPKAKK